MVDNLIVSNKLRPTISKSSDMDHSSARAYQYITLNGDARNFRLLVLQAGQPSNPMHCRLRTTSFESNSDLCYEALSYMWGDTTPSATILLDDKPDGKPFEVRRNLWWASIALRYPVEDRVRWIDAISINQSDVPERNHQVQQMAEVYGRADRV